LHTQSNFEGGIRVNAWVSGGAVPAKQRGTKLTGLVAIWDWYATFAEVAGTDPTDAAAAAAGLPAIDSVSMLKYITGEAKSSPRRSIAVGSSTPCTGCHCTADHKFSNDPCLNLWGGNPSNTTLGGIILDVRPTDGSDDSNTGPSAGLWKLLIDKLPMNGWQGPQFPNVSTATWIAETEELDCGSEGCLFELEADPTEHHDLRAEATSGSWPILPQLMKMLLDENQTVFSPDRGSGAQGAACAQAAANGGYWGPWLK
jgi:hypothetical protein